MSEQAHGKQETESRHWTRLDPNKSEAPCMGGTLHSSTPCDKKSEWGLGELTCCTKCLMDYDKKGQKGS